MKFIVDGRTIDEDDIKDTHITNPKEYHIDDMEPFLTIDLKNGEQIITTNTVKIAWE